MTKYPASAVSPLVLSAIVVFAATAVNAQSSGQIRRSAKPAHGRYIVVLNPSEDAAAIGAEAAGLHRGRLRHVFVRALLGFAIEVPEAAARTLAADPRVRYVEQDGLVSTSSVQLASPWGLDRIDQRPLPLDNTYSYPSGSASVNVHVIDTGIRTTHVEFGGRAAIAADYVDDDGDGDPYDIGNDDPNPVPDGSDCNGHGTHVAGTIGGDTYGVAKNVSLWAHRVLDCAGSGYTSSVIAAVDAVTASGQRPAVVNMSLGGSASSALDEAVRRSIAAGFVYVAAAGNSNVDASAGSPARVAEAITVAATGSNDARASYSNFGSAVDLFAPGSGIRSASYSSDTGTADMSGTSMAAPHVAGVAALYLQQNPTATPKQVRDGIVAAATPGVVSAAGTGSPNLLLYSGFLLTIPVVTLTSPNGGERLFVGTPYAIEWTWSEPNGTFTIERSPDGITYTAIPGCVNLAAPARTCAWTPAAAASKTWLRVKATNEAGTTTDVSNGYVTVSTGSAVITVKTPNTLIDWAAGSVQKIAWSHNLGSESYVRLELSRDGGATFPETIAAAVKNTTASSGSYDWRVTAPTAANAKVRISWTKGPGFDVSDVGFKISSAQIAVTAVSSLGWGYGTTQRVSWTSNLGLQDRVRVELSTDGGVTYPTVLATNIVATAKAVDVVVPTLTSPTTAARVQVTWENGVAPSVASGRNAAFKIGIAYATLGAIQAAGWGYGTQQRPTWATNLGYGDRVRLELSTDGGATYPTALVSNATATANVASVVVPSLAAPVYSAKLRLVWENASAGATPAAESTLFRIAAPFITTIQPSAAGWGYRTLQRMAWTTNLGAGDRVAVQLIPSVGTGAVALGSNVVANVAYLGVTVPTLAAGTAAARVRVAWTNSPSASTAAAETSPFAVKEPFVTVLTPNGGETWTIGRPLTVTWADNLGALERVKVLLSTDGGATFAVTALLTTPSDGSQAIVSQASWATAAAVVKLEWVKEPTVSDQSDGMLSVR